MPSFWLFMFSRKLKGCFVNVLTPSVELYSTHKPFCHCCDDSLRDGSGKTCDCISIHHRFGESSRPRATLFLPCGAEAERERWREICSAGWSPWTGPLIIALYPLRACRFSPSRSVGRVQGLNAFGQMTVPNGICRFSLGLKGLWLP